MGYPHLAVSEIIAARDAGLISDAEAKYVVRSFYPQLSELDRAKATVARVEESA